MRCVSTRQYRSVIPEMADTVGVSKSSVSRLIIEASEAEVETLLGRRFDELKLVVIYIDGMVFGDHVDRRRGRGRRRPQACAGHPRRGDRKCHRGQRTVGRSGGSCGLSFCRRRQLYTDRSLLSLGNRTFRLSLPRTPSGLPMLRITNPSNGASPGGRLMRYKRLW
jgi:hypothetical protein